MTTIQKFNKKDLALVFLDRAIEMYDKEDYFCSLHLAGAAEEILGVCLRVKGIENSLETDIKGVVLISKNFYKRDMTKEEARTLIITPQNSIKHMSDEADAFAYLDPQEEAKDMLVRALTNLWRLGETPIRYERFWENLENRS